MAWFPCCCGVAYLGNCGCFNAIPNPVYCRITHSPDSLNNVNKWPATVFAMAWDEANRWFRGTAAVNYCGLTLNPVAILRCAGSGVGTEAVFQMASGPGWSASPYVPHFDGGYCTSRYASEGWRIIASAGICGLVSASSEAILFEVLDP